MKRRDSLKAIALTALSTGVLLQSCESEKKPETTSQPATANGPDRQEFEKVRDARLYAEKFFTEHELATVAVLSDIIIPKDDVSGSATEAGVPGFIEFIVKDIPRHQLPMRGGLKWLDTQSLKRTNKSFKDCSPQEQLSLVDEIAYPSLAKPDMQQGVSFFNLMRDLTVIGFYTSEMGIKDIGYMGNKPNQWDGVPQEVLDQYGLKYDERTLKECVRWDNAQA
jgi:hypothetical protein